MQSAQCNLRHDGGVPPAPITGVEAAHGLGFDTGGNIPKTLLEQEPWRDVR
jgi:hypothetical protein